MRRAGLTAVVLAVAFVTGTGNAWAEATTTMCVPEEAGQPVLSGAQGKCSAASYKPLLLPGKRALNTLSKILPYLSYQERGVGGKPTVRFSGVNVQIVDGAGQTFNVNGAGNLVIGYDETTFQVEQTGSHNLILGEEQMYTSYGGIVAGQRNAITAPFATVTGGRANSARNSWATVTGGLENRADGGAATVAGGEDNRAIGTVSAVLGGEFNMARGLASAIAGGGGNETSSGQGTISGGNANRAGSEGWIGGGYRNETTAQHAAIFGGRELIATNEFEAIP